MKRELRITTDPIPAGGWAVAPSDSADVGAVVQFYGIVRGSEQGQAIAALEYEAFEKMARHQFNLLFSEMERRWPIHSVQLVHRIGPVRAGEPSLWVAIAAPHRAEAFAACQFLIDEMKRVVPIWKRPLRNFS